ncbi:MAG: serine hydrolase [Magnetococcales bacterium]|nr:serine hydrolase [Magnetococcales bacterium]
MKKIWLNEKFSALAAISLGLVSAACGGGGGDGSNTSAAVGPSFLTGVFSDAPVKNLYYETYRDSTLTGSGTTNDSGEFKYSPLDTNVKFKANGMAIGEAAPSALVTPLDIISNPFYVDTAETLPGNKSKVVKLLQFLQHYDTDKTDNIITLSNDNSLATTTFDSINANSLTYRTGEQASKHFMDELDRLNASSKKFYFSRLTNKPELNMTVSGATSLSDQWNSRKTTVEAKIQAKLDSVVKNATDSTKHGTLPGVVIRVRLPNGEDKTFVSGYANMGASNTLIQTDDVPMTANHHFRFGSITKTLTGMAVIEYLTAADKTIDDTLYTLLGGSDAALLAKVNTNNVLTSADSLKNLTVYDLLSHKSGLKQTSSQSMTDSWGYYNWSSTWSLIGFQNPGLTGTALNIRTSPFTAQELLDISYGLGIEASGSWHYSNANYVLLGIVLETLANTSWDAAVMTKFGPTGTSAQLTGLDNYDGTTRPPTLPGGNTVGVKGYIDWHANFGGACEGTTNCLKDTRYEVAIHPSFYGAAGGMTGSVDDLYTWAAYLGTKINDVNHPLGKKDVTWDRTTRPEAYKYYYQALPTSTALHMGPGVFKNRPRKLIGHPGQVQGNDCYVGYRYDVGEPIAACANSTIKNDGKIQIMVLNEVMDLIDGKTE